MAANFPMTVSNVEQNAGIVSKEYRDWTAKPVAILCKVEWEKVTVDPAYQRLHDGKHSDKLAQRSPLFRPYPILSYRNGTLYADDGQHRKEAGYGGCAVQPDRSAIGAVVQ